jgi:hypothetical protein
LGTLGAFIDCEIRSDFRMGASTLLTKSIKLSQWHPVQSFTVGHVISIATCPVHNLGHMSMTCVMLKFVALLERIMLITFGINYIQLLFHETVVLYIKALNGYC